MATDPPEAAPSSPASPGDDVLPAALFAEEDADGAAVDAAAADGAAVDAGAAGGAAVDAAAADGGTPWMERLLAGAVPDPEVVRLWVGRFRRPDEPVEALAKRIADRTTWMQATQGAALALPGSVPGLGTAAMIAAEVGSITAETGLLLRNQGWMQSALAEAHGLPPDPELRRREAILTLGLWAGAVTACPRETGRTFAAKQVKKLPTKAVKKIAVLVGKKMAAKLTAKRGVVAIGKVVPFGIGAVVGGGFAYWVMRGLSNTALGYYQLGSTELRIEGDET